MIIEWLIEAVKERNQLLDYVAQENPLAAANLDDEIEKQVELLINHPFAGREGRVLGTRELVINRTPYILTYRIISPRIQILNCLHGSQKWPR